ncbi:unnamed protein product [Cuscuta epithymum]|uniref:Epidermal patterning factor-like protein n=1 Tax=Cuscuta epithymum TaxID=186058 RepID=A0AAV0EG87_9ASTE|nr:unnamed protein product [Cuscuta epithymum]
MFSRSYILLCLLLTLALPNAETRPFAPTNSSLLQGEKKAEGGRRIGSFAPRCDHKCYGCMPCEAIQVPATNGGGGGGAAAGVQQYTNYEPEGWKCKCGPALYSP